MANMKRWFTAPDPSGRALQPEPEGGGTRRHQQPGQHQGAGADCLGVGRLRRHGADRPVVPENGGSGLRGPGAVRGGVRLQRHQRGRLEELGPSSTASRTSASCPSTCRCRRASCASRTTICPMPAPSKGIWSGLWTRWKTWPAGPGRGRRSSWNGSGSADTPSCRTCCTSWWWKGSPAPRCCRSTACPRSGFWRPTSGTMGCGMKRKMWSGPGRASSRTTGPAPIWPRWTNASPSAWRR